MLLKPRKKSSELLILEFLNCRMALSPKDKQHYTNLAKGYEGEQKFDLWTEQLQCDCLILNDLLLKSNSTTFQIDALILTAEQINFYEVKNFEGDYFYDAEQDKFYKRPQYEIVNPLHQLARSKPLLNQLLLNQGFKTPIEDNVVFINNEFTLYQAPPDKPIIYPNQLKRYFNKFNVTPSKLSKRHFLLAEKLNSLHIADPPAKQIPPYHYEQLRKGITCSRCKSYALYIKWATCVCDECGCEEPLSYAVIRTVKEFQLLFPEHKITSKIIHDWCQVVKSKRTISNILGQNFKAVGERRWTHYV